MEAGGLEDHQRVGEAVRDEGTRVWSEVPGARRRNRLEGFSPYPALTSRPRLTPSAHKLFREIAALVFREQSGGRENSARAFPPRDGTGGDGRVARCLARGRASRSGQLQPDVQSAAAGEG